MRRRVSLRMVLGAAITFSGVMLIGCASPADNKPAVAAATTYKTTIDFPKSLTAKSSASGSMAANIRSLVAAEVASGTKSEAYAQVQSAMEQLVSQAKMNAQYGIMVNAVISQNKLSPSDAKKTGLKLTLTQAMVNSMKEAMPSSAQDTVDMTSAIGQEMTVPDFVYKASENSNFVYQLAMTQEDVGPDGKPMTSTNTFYWTSDYSRTAMKFEGGGFEGYMVYDSSSKSAYMSFKGSGFTFAMSAIVDASTVASHGTYLNQTFTATGMKGTLTAYGDDAGGQVINTYTNTTANYKGTMTECFDAKGSLTYKKTDVDEASLPAGVTVADSSSGTLNATYNAKLTPLPMDFGKASTLF